MNCPKCGTAGHARRSLLPHLQRAPAAVANHPAPGLSQRPQRRLRSTAGLFPAAAGQRNAGRLSATLSQWLSGGAAVRLSAGLSALPADLPHRLSAALPVWGNAPESFFQRHERAAPRIFPQLQKPRRGFPQSVGAQRHHHRPHSVRRGVAAQFLRRNDRSPRSGQHFLFRRLVPDRSQSGRKRQFHESGHQLCGRAHRPFCRRRDGALPVGLACAGAGAGQRHLPTGHLQGALLVACDFRAGQHPQHSFGGSRAGRDAAEPAFAVADDRLRPVRHGVQLPAAWGPAAICHRAL